MKPNSHSGSHKAVGGVRIPSYALDTAADIDSFHTARCRHFPELDGAIIRTWVQTEWFVMNRKPTDYDLAFSTQRYANALKEWIWYGTWLEVWGSVWTSHGASSVLLYVLRENKDYLGRGAQDGHLDFHTVPELCCGASKTKADVVSTWQFFFQFMHLEGPPITQPEVTVCLKKIRKSSSVRLFSKCFDGLHLTSHDHSCCVSKTNGDEASTWQFFSSSRTLRDHQ